MPFQRVLEGLMDHERRKKWLDVVLCNDGELINIIYGCLSLRSYYFSSKRL
jgi:hypothetical protein